MRRTDIVPGKVYAWRRMTGGTDPIVFLGDPQRRELWCRDGWLRYRPDPLGGYHPRGSAGHPAVRAIGDTDPDLLLAVTLDDLRAPEADRDAWDLGMRYELVTDFSRVTGEWD
jgi:hypothetical protein